MNTTPDFKCSYGNCQNNYFFSPCNEQCCKGLELCYCEDHNDPSIHPSSSSFGSKSFTVFDEVQDQSQDSIFPTDSITSVGDIPLSNIELGIIAEFKPLKNRNCISRSIFTKVQVNGIDKWKCKVCQESKTYKYCPKTTANIRNHCQAVHSHLWNLLSRKKDIGNHLQSASLEFAAQPTIEDAEDICVGISASFSKLMKYFEISSVLAVLATVLDCRYKMEYYNKDGKVSNV
jgi:hypothetical protein